jgi:hypothetical protein
MNGGVFVSQGLQFVEHCSDVPVHTDLIGLGMVDLGPRLAAAGLMVA